LHPLISPHRRRAGAGIPGCCSGGAENGEARESPPLATGFSGGLKDIRTALAIAPGDRIVWQVAPGGKAIVRRAQKWDLEYLRAVEGTLSEWTGPADEEAYRDL
jgi:hypothetical protein